MSAEAVVVKSNVSSNPALFTSTSIGPSASIAGMRASRCGAVTQVARIGLAPDIGGQLLERSPATGDHSDRGALRRELPGQFLTDAPGRASDDDPLALKLHGTPLQE